MNPTLLVLLALAVDPPAPSVTPTPEAAPTAAAELASPPEPLVYPPEPLVYPLGPRGVPDFAASGEPFSLTDLRYSVSDVDGTQQTFAARVRYRNWGYLGAEVEGERRGLSMMTHRLSVSAFSEDGSWDLGGEFRARRFVVSTTALRRAAPSHSWRVAPSLAFRVVDGLELAGWLVTDSERPFDSDERRTRLRTELGAELFWQRGARLEALAGFQRRYELTDTLDENRIDTGFAHAVAQLGRLELSGEASLEDVVGRFPRRESAGALRARLPLVGRLLLEASARGRFDRGSELDHEYGGSLTWFGRRVTLPRAGRAAARAAALARRARASGEYEFGAFDEGSIRAQRERLSLSGEREALRQDVEALYRAQLEERLVPLLGLELRDLSDGLSGERVRAARALVGIPWPPSLPWRAREGCVPFLQLELEHRWHTTGPELRSGANAVAVTLALNREMDLVVRWSRSGATALDILRGLDGHRRFEVSYVYARGR